MSDYSNYDELIGRINDNLSASDAQFGKVSDAASSDCDINITLNNYPNMEVVKNNAGEVIGYDYVHTYESTPDTEQMSIDSNTDSGRFGGGQTRGVGAGRYSGSYYSSQGELKSGAVDKDGNQVNTVSGYISSAWASVSALAKMGLNVTAETAAKVFEMGSHAATTFSDIFTKVGDMAQDEADAIRTLFGVNSNGNTTMYMDEDTIGALAIQAKDDGFFSNGEPSYPEHQDTGTVTITGYGNLQDIFYNEFEKMARRWGYEEVRWNSALVEKLDNFFTTHNHCIGLVCLKIRSPDVFWASGCYVAGLTDVESTQYIGNSYTAGAQIANGSRVHFQIRKTKPSGYSDYILETGPGGTQGETIYANVGTWERDVGYNEKFFSSINVTSIPAVPGVSHQTGATIPVDAITGADPHVVAQNLALNYPNLMGDPITITIMNENCQPVTKKYYAVPVSYSPTNVGVDAPITGGLQVDPSFNPDVSIDLPDIDMSKYVEQIMDQLSGTGAGRGVTRTTADASGAPVIVPLLPTIPATGEGDAPEPVTPQITDAPLWHVYNPSSSEARAFGAWLWSSNIIDQIIRVFQNPLDGVIGLHAIYAEPSTSGSANIVCGNVASNVSAAIVDSQYITLSCGYVWLTEYFGNVFDYSPYTSISLFLPFIGIVSLNPADVMRAKLSIVYNIDVYTGACIAMIEVERDGAGGVIYQFSGNCAVSFPTSAVTYNSIFSSMVSIAAGIASIAVAPTTPAAVVGAASAAHGLTSAKQDVSKSGAFTANAGAMGPKKPYLIITRPQTNMALNYEEYDGRGANQTVMLKDIHGYARCKIVHLNIPQAFGDELKEIHEILTTGVILP